MHCNRLVDAALSCPVHQRYSTRSSHSGHPGTKLMLIMRLTIFLIILASFKVTAGTYAQSISFSGTNVPLEKALSVIKQQTEYVVFYDYNLLQKAKPVTISADNITLRSFLDMVLKDQSLIYVIKDKTIIISKRTRAATPVSAENILSIFVPVTGRVVDSLGNPLVGATITVKGSTERALTDADGKFSLNANAGDELVVTYVGFNTVTFRLSGELSAVNITMKYDTTKLDEVAVVSTGYQDIPQERATGSFVVIDKVLFNRAVSTNVLDRIKDLVPGILFNKAAAGVTTSNMIIRGPANTRGNSNPLIVVDNFPYSGDINNLNPNDVETVTVLKDAAAASIWGARSGNGVIVITTKKGKFNQKLRADLNINTTFNAEPDIYKITSFLPSASYIDVERQLFAKGDYVDEFANVTSFPAVSPVVEILEKQRKGLISQAEADAQINAYRNIDVRDEYSKYMYRGASNQQYALNISGGNEKAAYTLSMGYDKLNGEMVRNSNDRFTLKSYAVFAPIKNLQVTTSVTYTQANTNNNNNQSLGSTFYNGQALLYPYAQFADASGQALPIIMTYRPAYVDSMRTLGFLDWKYRPLDERNNADNSSQLRDLMLNLDVRYKIRPYLDISFQYMNENQHTVDKNYVSTAMYSTRNSINRFSQYNASTKKITYILPNGGILNGGDGVVDGYAYRGSLNLNKTFGLHNVSAIAGGEIRQQETNSYKTLIYGYNDELGIGSNNLNFNTQYPVLPLGTATITAPTGVTTTITNRYVSYFANASYTYNGRYTASISGRKDGTNFFGVNANDRFTPLWSAGLSWDISKEEFYHVHWLEYLKLRATYGYNGNVSSGSGYITGNYQQAILTNLTSIGSLSAPNPELNWERVRNVNVGIDFALRNNKFGGTIELFKKEGVDIVQAINIAPSTGFSSFQGNAAATSAKGIDLSLYTTVVNRAIKWNVYLINSVLRERVTRYDVPLTSSSFRNNGGAIAMIGKPLFGIYGYKWAGLDPANGDPRGYFKGNVSKEYSNIMNNFALDSLAYVGTSRPPVWGSLRNEVSWKGLTLSAIVSYKLNYYFRRTSISGNMADLVSTGMNVDYDKRWQKAGDEKFTNVPSLAYPSVSARSTFYQYSEALVEKGDHIRLQSIRLAYTIPPFYRVPAVQGINVYAYANNLGILWKANKYGLDPDNALSYPVPFSISFGIQATIK